MNDDPKNVRWLGWMLTTLCCRPHRRDFGPPAHQHFIRACDGDGALASVYRRSRQPFTYTPKRPIDHIKLAVMMSAVFCLLGFCVVGVYVLAGIP